MSRNNERNNKFNTNGSKGNPKARVNNKKNTKSYKKGSPYQNADAQADTSREKTNDVSWYAKNPELLRDAGDLSFNNPVGSKVTFRGSVTKEVGDYVDLDQFYVPGIMVLKANPIPGISKGSNSPLNVAARNIYSWVRHANSGHANYEAPDLMLYLLAMDNAYAMYAHYARVLGVLTAYDQKNRYYAKYLVEAMGCNYDDLSTKISDFRYFLNMYAKKINSLYVPATLDLFKRHSFIYSRLWKDADSEKAQIYAIIPNCYYVYKPTTSTSGGMLARVDMRNTQAGVSLDTYDTITTILNSIINPILTDEDMNIMSGDIRKAYGDALYTLGIIPEDYVIFPEYDITMLHQIHNMSIVPGIPDDQTLDVTQMDGYIHYNPTYKAYAGGTRDAHGALPFITIRSNTVSPEMVMEATRLSATYTEGELGAFEVQSCGSELIEAAWLGYFTDNSGLSYVQFSSVTTAKVGVDPTSDVVTLFSKLEPCVAMLTRYSTFDWAPPMDVWIFDVDSNKMNFAGRYQDLDNYTVLDSNVLYKLNETALLSLFGVPQP